MEASPTLFLITFALMLGASRGDFDLLQDVCVADLYSGVKVNGFPCKHPSTIGPNDFFFCGLANPGIPNNTVGSVVTLAHVEKIPGLNTLGVAMSRIDYAPGGVNPPHIHPRASEILFVLEGELEVGFLTTANVLMSKVIKKGEVFVFPKGLVHFQKNIGTTPAAVITAFNSQFPGTQSIAATLFAASPAVPCDVLSKAFQISDKEVQIIKSKLTPKKQA
ncbi:Germin-like protein subfamily 2 member 2 [Hibiscus syriacus]|uniref:Germin-like protein n=1 Tax=Hibiscus syriacus TaxID=106335 RepID=A0A6A3ADL2_HIBSY|nr:germin-like protein subfamily 2 member 1 [Hibiscus syriacus]KAE8702691.1 Germin-like protein subfamily 2 member 2 [Hibiscus syriacus]